ncbi:MAG: nitroreductase family protein [Bacillota bacterium]|nr:nitroreductase family protein [Bacillota bacterium]
MATDVSFLTKNSEDFYNAIESRRSIYGISKDSLISEERLLEVINKAVKYTPSSFNAQSSRVVVLIGQQHNKLWDITETALRRVVPAENFSETQQKMDAFRRGYGTVLFYEDENVIKGLQQKFALYADNFPVWSNQSSGMLQYVVWTSLELEGFGASLQHYNPLIDEDVRKQWNIPGNWKLIAEMPFGKPTAPAAEKDFIPLEERVKIFK